MKTDVQTQRDVLDELQFEPAVDSSDIGIVVHDGIVTLTGKAKSLAEKWAAVRSAERVAGVRAVVDELKVDVPAPYHRTDEDIARTVLNTIKWNVLVAEKNIKVHVENGWVILKGTVDYTYQKHAVESAISSLAGVKGITNHIKIKPVATSPEVKTKIEDAMRRAAEVDAQHIRVNVAGNKVILQGKVHSWVERNEAERAAWSVPGVTQVDDHLVIAG